MNILKSTIAIAGLTLAFTTESFAEPTSVPTIVYTDMLCSDSFHYWVQVKNKDGLPTSTHGYFPCHSHSEEPHKVDFQTGGFDYRDGDTIEIYEQNSILTPAQPVTLLKKCSTKIRKKNEHGAYLDKVKIDLTESLGSDNNLSCTIVQKYHAMVNKFKQK